MRRTLVALALAGTLVLAGCAGSAGTPADVADAAIALQQVGFDTGLADAPKTGTGDAPRKALRKYLRRNTLHGEVAIQTKDGVKTVVVQRGSVTAVTGTGVSVKSTDGFALTWTFGDKLRVVQNKKAAAISAIQNGAEIGIAGVRDGDVTSARLVAIK
jgi:hypothetical protein